jgi:hypothetical protein
MLCKMKYITSIKRLLTCLRVVAEVHKREKKNPIIAICLAQHTLQIKMQCSCKNNKLKCVSLFIMHLKNYFKIELLCCAHCERELSFYSQQFHYCTPQIMCDTRMTHWDWWTLGFALCVWLQTQLLLFYDFPRETQQKDVLKALY